MKNIFGFVKNFAVVSLTTSLFFGALFILPKTIIKANEGDGIDLLISDFQVSKNNNDWGSSVSGMDARQKVYFFAQFENKGRIPAENLTLKLDMPENTKNPTVNVQISSNSPKDGAGAKDTDSKEVAVSLKEDNYRLFYDSNSAKAKGDFDGSGIKEISLGGDFLNNGKNIGTVVTGKTITVEFQGYVVATGDPKLDVVFRAKNKAKGGDWSSNVSAGNGDKVSFLMEIHNTVVGTEAEGVKFRVDMPTEIASKFNIKGIANSSNAGSDRGEVSINFNNGNSRAIYEANSLKISWDQDGDGKADYDEKSLNDSRLFSDGISLPDGKILYGCYNYIAYIYFDAKVEQQESEIWIDKFVSNKDGDYKRDLKDFSFKPGDKVYFLIEYGNRGNADTESLKIIDELPDYLTWLSGEGDYSKDDNEVEFNIKTIKAGRQDRVRFVAKVADNAKNDCYQNKAEVKKNKEVLAKDKSEYCVEKEGKVVVATSPKALPETGSNVLVTIGAVVMTFSGILLRRKIR
jgi:LPXTG-motif cell wall-anchored protein